MLSFVEQNQPTVFDIPILEGGAVALVGTMCVLMVRWMMVRLDRLMENRDKQVSELVSAQQRASESIVAEQRVLSARQDEHTKVIRELTSAVHQIAINVKEAGK